MTMSDKIYRFKTAVLNGHPLWHLHAKQYKEVSGGSV